VVGEIDEVVRQTRFTGWQTSFEGTRAVKKAIRSALAKYGLAKDAQLFEKAFDYVAEHY
jgi:type I restriction enzyme R subunit